MKKISDEGKLYLLHLNLPLETPTENYLKRICQAHLTTFPFENISKLLSFRDKDVNIPSYSQFVKNFTASHFGGTCYTLNSNLIVLLKELGFACHLAMLGNQHMAIIVNIDSEKMYVDCGAAAPMFKPVRFESDHQNSSRFGEDYVNIVPASSENNSYRYIRYIRGKQSGKAWNFDSKKAYEVNDFADIIQKSYIPQAAFMSMLRCQLWQIDQNRNVSLVNNQLGIRYSNGQTITKTLSCISEIEEVMANEFLLSKLPVAEAIEVLKSLGVDVFSERA
ncbi:arylamine N-acetyltransferase [Bacillus gobiensis]|uniref:Arylamine N-acetyltransferase n=1 Tax=Bacillus gobiensis TaxID=1441095 RepID=A0A0M4G6F8_9BACI|nr:arylamine N-acetyltransferase [Bacillus gobiensis]ALC80458.1 hypothetical protein AM592_01815 [Bacillus gobiensis]